MMQASTSIHLERSESQDVFRIQFHNTTIAVCVHGLMNLLSSIHERDGYLIDLGLLYSTEGCSLASLDNDPMYRLCFGRTILLLSEREMVQLMAQLWDNNPVLMYWVLAEEQVCS